MADLPCELWPLPIPDDQGPDDDQAFQCLAKEAANTLRQGKHILVHCGAGIGRTGMVAIAILMALGVQYPEACVTVSNAGSQPEQPAQREALMRVATMMATEPRREPAV